MLSEVINMATVREIDDRIAEIDERTGELEVSPFGDVAKRWHSAIQSAKAAYKPKRRGIFGRKKADEPEPDWEQAAATNLGRTPEGEELEVCREYTELLEERKALSAAKFEMVRSGKSTAQVNLEASRARQAQRKKRAAGLVCPKCGSENVVAVGNTGKDLSAGKALAGAMIAGTAGAVIGASMGTKGKTEWVCRDCGKRYTK